MDLQHLRPHQRPGAPVAHTTPGTRSGDNEVGHSGQQQLGQRGLHLPQPAPHARGGHLRDNGVPGGSTLAELGWGRCSGGGGVVVVVVAPSVVVFVLGALVCAQE